MQYPAEPALSCFFLVKSRCLHYPQCNSTDKSSFGDSVVGCSSAECNFEPLASSNDEEQTKAGKLNTPRCFAIFFNYYVFQTCSLQGPTNTQVTSHEAIYQISCSSLWSHKIPSTTFSFFLSVPLCLEKILMQFKWNNPFKNALPQSWRHFFLSSDRLMF